MVNRHSQFAQAKFKQTQRNWRALLPHLPQMQQLMLQLMYECNISTQQLTQLRLKDVDWQAGKIHLYDKSLQLQRSVTIPETLHSELKIQCMQVKSLYLSDKANGWVKVQLPQKVMHLQNALGKRQEWQFLFPASRVVNSYAASVLRRSPGSCAALNNQFARAGRIARIRNLANAWPKSNQPKAPTQTFANTNITADEKSTAAVVKMNKQRQQMDLFAASA